MPNNGHDHYNFKDKVKIDSDVMWALRDKYGITGIAKKAETNRRTLFAQFEFNVFWQTEMVAKKIMAIYESECK
jgi:hypothetical protein